MSTLFLKLTKIYSKEKTANSSILSTTPLLFEKRLWTSTNNLYCHIESSVSICLSTYMHFCCWQYVLGSIKRVFSLIECVSAVQGHPSRWFWYQWKARMRLFISPYSNFGPILHSFWDAATCWLNIANFSYTSLILLSRFECSLGNFRWILSRSN